MTAVVLPQTPPDAAIVDLDDPLATDGRRAGGKAAALARARRAGLPTLPGSVITTAVSSQVDSGTPLDGIPGLEEVLAVAGARGRSVVVRSSSVVEDQRQSSKAGQFESVLDVHGVDELRRAVSVVLASRRRAGAEHEPIAVLVQPMVTPEVSGVYFGVDPVTGRADRRVVTAVAGLPDGLVGGRVDGSRYVTDPAGRPIEEDVRDGVALTARRLRALVGLGDRLAEEFGCPQDVEWAVVDGELLVLQSRPVTTHVSGVPRGPVFGPGPVAETFPEALARLEVDLWVPPLREGVRAALRVAGAVPDRVLDQRDLVITVHGRVAIDLEVTGDVAARRSWPARLAARARRLRTAWAIGRLRVSLPIVADDLVRRVDADLESVPPLHELTTRQLVALIARGRDGLRSLHAHEVLLGMVADPVSSHFTGASVALRVLAESREEGWSDDQILRRAPVVLVLVPPRIGAPLELPRASSSGALAYDPPAAPDSQVRREALRMRVRWMQELVGQAAAEIGARLVERGQLPRADLVRHLSFEDLSSIVARRGEADRAVLEAAEAGAGSGPALPARFRLGDSGEPISVQAGGRAGGGTGAGGGRGRGPVTHDMDDPPRGSVLVVRTLSPSIGPHLPRLAGIVSETGSVLSHLAILARESGVATVVGHHGALDELVEGTVVTVDGQGGTVEPEDFP